MKFHFVLLGALCAHTLAQDENNKALRATATYTNVTWNDEVLRTDLKSTLFGTCIGAANTRKMQNFYIQDPAQGIEFVKYDVSRFEKGLRPVNWERAIPCKDILDCAMASKDYLMFQYNGTTCRMANGTYVGFAGWFCDELDAYKKDVVYVNTAVPPSGCPATTDVLVENSTSNCVGGTTLDVPLSSMDWPHASCYYHYGGRVYSESSSVKFATIRDYLRNKNYQGNFYIDARYSTIAGNYLWADESAVNKTYFAVEPKEPAYQNWVVISSSHDYLLIPMNTSDMPTGFLCSGHPN